MTKREETILTRGMFASEGFDWSQVHWGGPQAKRTTRCSYCQQPLPRDDEEFFPLMLWKEDGSCAEFCDQCQQKWFGVVSFKKFETEEGKKWN